MTLLDNKLDKKRVLFLGVAWQNENNMWSRIVLKYQIWYPLTGQIHCLELKSCVVYSSLKSDCRFNQGLVMKNWLIVNFFVHLAGDMCILPYTEHMLSVIKFNPFHMQSVCYCIYFIIIWYIPLPAICPQEMPLVRGGQRSVNCHCKFNHSQQFAELQSNLIKRTHSDPLKENVCAESIALQGQC